MSWELMIGLLPWLLILACPISMFWMMRGMSHGGACGGQRKDTEGSPVVVPVRNPDEEIRLLKERLARLEATRQRPENWS